ncbi:FAD-dependent oxidoreductase [Cellulophaga sp. 20_2_10]|uniref:flavin monoamine oxidase family protein n=1 Tax=Cellulophaga sp. 20_2_10 TaxID=2942476 RepID=UPI00201AF66D|nr:NAD(P)/FAD-dependent oxidoreductase [Cellulophaga sp. 20_2_10]MCL5246640.1 FAD-dependent oxidoreductase [Cellulophaga sp. 20_2_10]
MILIIGAGLSGLLTAYHLKKEGIPFKILEARDRIGGRIHTVYKTNEAPVEMGATWFTSQHTYLRSLLEELGINYFEQHMGSKVFYQPSSAQPPQLVTIPNESTSYRISGGTSNLINTLFSTLDPNNVLLNQTVKKISFEENSVLVEATENFKATKVVLALPPKLWSKNILFTPSLPSSLMSIATETHTWMEDSIKVALTFEAPFWEQENIPATLFSNAGPVTEFYDHCDPKRSVFALCGFINAAYKQFSNAERQEAVIKQLKNTYGSRVLEYVTYQECLWNKEEYTFKASEDFLFPHQNNGNPIFSNSFFNEKLLISSSESALEFPGYMNGAVLAATVTAKKIITAQQGI